MITLDSITIAINIDLVDVLSNKFTNTTDPDGVITNQLYKPDIIGFNKIEIKSDIVRFDISSKILLDRYKLGININTIELVFDAIDATGIIKFKSRSLLDFKVHKCDFVANFYVDKPQANYYNALNSICNSNYNNQIYQNSSLTGISYTSNNQSKDKNYLKFYDKQEELYRSSNKGFMNLTNWMLLDQFSNVIRIELRANSFKQIRDFAAIKDNNLHDLLFSDENPIYKVFCQIIGSSIQHNCMISDLTNVGNSKDLHKNLEFIGCKYLLENSNNDINYLLSVIRQGLKSNEMHKSNTSRVLKNFSQLCSNVIQSQFLSENKSNASEYIDEIKNFLLNES